MDQELTAWGTLAIFLDFEEAHDRTYGSPIVGHSPYYNKDKNGNPIKNDNSNGGSTTSYNSSYDTTSSKAGGCYIATAVYGSYDCPQVWTLRRYRDYHLAEHWYGRAFIRFYYAVSPAIVKCFGGTNWFNSIWRKKLDAMVNELQKNGYSSAPYTDKNWR